MNRRLAAVLLAAAPMVLATAGIAQPAYPERPVRLVVPYPPGASTDTLGRLVAQKLGEALGQPVIVDNRAGASGNIGSDHVAKGPADGYTFLLGTDATHTSNMHLVANPPFHPVRDFAPLTLAVANPIILVTHPSVPAKNLTELIAYVRANPDKGSYGSSGTGSPHHLAGELLKKRTGAPLVHVPYKGGGPALNDVLGGNIPMVFASLITAMPHVQSGRLNAIGVTNDTRYPGLPQVPTLAETLPGFDMPSWLGFFAPAATPQPIVQRLSSEIIKILKTEEVSKRMAGAGLVVVANTPDQFAAQVKAGYEQRGQLIREAGIKAE